jgi:hemoglobin
MPVIDQIGGEEGVHALVTRFYDLIETLPQGAAILAMHQTGQRNGHMNLREIHAHIEIRTQDAEDWLALMDQAMEDTAVAEPMRGQIMATFRRAAHMLVNVP